MIRRTAVALVTQLFATAAAATAAEIQVCEHKNYGGRCVTLLHGVNGPARLGMSNTISSFRVRSGTCGCAARPPPGHLRGLHPSVSDLSGTGCRTAVSSLRPVRGGSGGGARPSWSIRRRITAAARCVSPMTSRT